MASLFDVFGRLLLEEADRKRFVADAEATGKRAGEAAGASMGQRVASAAKIGFKVFAGIAATALAGASAAGLELNQTLSDLQAETGATGDDWAAMQAVVRRENGRTTESLDEIAAATKAMRQDLNLTGPEIDKYSDRIFNAGLATHTSAATIVKDVDDIADGYNVSLDRALGSVDQLIASQERWGGSIEARLQVLPQLAAALRGLNGTVDDGVALLNVASASGLDYTDVLGALNKAVGSFKPPPALDVIIKKQATGADGARLYAKEVDAIVAALGKIETPTAMATILATLQAIPDPVKRATEAERIYNAEVAALSADPLQRYIDILAAIPDDQARTQKATELFGAKSARVWAQLTGTIGRAGGSLDSFNVTQADAGDKANELAAQLDRGPIRSLKLMGEQLGALLADAGSNPLVTGIASFGTILGGFAPNLSGKVAGGLIRGMKGAWVKVAASSVVTGAVGFAADKAATLYLKALFAGDAISGALAGVWRRTVGSAAVQGAIGAASSAAATAYLKALILGDTISGAISSAWTAGSGRIAAAAAAQGGIAGKAFSLAASAAVLAAPIVVAFVLAPIAQGMQDANAADLHKRLSEALQTGTDQAVAEAEQHLALLERGARASHNDSFLNIILGERRAFELALQGRAADIKDATPVFVAAAAQVATATGAALNGAAAVGRKAGQRLPAEYGAGVADGTGTATHAVEVFAGKVKDDLAGAGIAGEAHRQGNLAAGAVATGIIEKRDAVDAAWASLLEAIKNSQSPAVQLAKLTGRLASTALVKGMHDKDPAVRAQAVYTKQLIIDQINALKPSASNLTKQAMANIRKAMKSADPDIRAAATAVYNAAKNPISKLPAKGYGYGAGLADQVAAGMKAHEYLVARVAAHLAGTAGQYLKLDSPAKKGPWSQNGGPEGWGSRFASFIARGIAGGMPEVNRAISSVLAGPQVPLFAGPSRLMLGAAGMGAGAAPLAGDTYYINATVAAQPAARNPLEVARQLGWASRQGVLRARPAKRS